MKEVKSQFERIVQEDFNQFREISKTFMKVEPTDIDTLFQLSLDSWLLGTRWSEIQSNASKIALDEDINKTIQRSLTKTLARHGLGLYIYAGEDLPEDEKDNELEKVIDKTKAQALDKSIENAGIKDEVVELILSGYGYTSTSEIKVKDFNSIVNDFKSKKE